MDHLHTAYAGNHLQKDQLHPDPMKQFEAWYKTAEDAGVPLHNAMSVATATPNAAPSVRMLLLKGLDERGFIFYTNYQSRKANELTENPQVALLFYWNQLARQVRIEGVVTKLSVEESAEYFHSRPHGSQLAASASPQSQPIPDRTFLMTRYQALESAHKEQVVPLPAFWGGYLVIPKMIEFWQGGMYRLHDRFRYTLGENELWQIERLAP